MQHVFKKEDDLSSLKNIYKSLRSLSFTLTTSTIFSISLWNLYEHDIHYLDKEEGLKKKTI